MAEMLNGLGPWVPEDTIKQQRQTARDFWETPNGGYGSGWAGGLAAALAGYGYGSNLSAADKATRENQALRSSTMQRAVAAPDNMSMAKLLMGSGIPGTEDLGISTLTRERDTAQNQAFQERLAKLNRDAAALEAAKSRAHAERMVTLHGDQAVRQEGQIAEQKAARDVKAVEDAANAYGVSPQPVSPVAALPLGAAESVAAPAPGQLPNANAALTGLQARLPPETYARAMAAAKAGNRQEALDIILGKDKIKDTFDLEEGKTRYQQVRQPDGSYKAVPIVAAPPKQDATTKKAIDEADDFVAQTQTAIGALKEAQRLNKLAYEGFTAEGRAAAMNNVPLLRGTENSSATTQLKNVITNQALQSLRATFGGNPTEGERKILLDVAGSVNMNAKDREDIYNRAMVMAEQRLAINQQKADALREGKYYSPGGQPAAANQPVSLAPQTAPVRVSSPDEARKLPSGTRIVLPDGSLGVVP